MLDIQQQAITSSGQHRRNITAWVMFSFCYIGFVFVGIADFWSPIRYDWHFASTGLAAPFAAFFYLSGLIVLAAQSLNKNWRAARTLLWFICVGVLFGGSAWLLESNLYISAREWGFGAFYLIAAIVVGGVAGGMTLLLGILIRRLRPPRP